MAKDGWHYRVNISAKRDKIALIKMFRAVTDWGLKDSKEFVEEHFDFDAWLDDWTTFDVTVTAHQLGVLTHHALANAPRMTINDSDRFVPPEHDPYDFTNV